VADDWRRRGREILVHRSHPLTTSNASITRALVLVHVRSGPARYEFRSALAGAYLAGALENTLISFNASVANRLL
jgi:hypothetical protein